MQQKAKLFMNGRSQAVRLPKEFRFDCTEVFIRQDSATGDVVISEKPEDWQGFFALVDEKPAPENFMAARGNALENVEELSDE